ncbi:MAG: hypothetical protein ABIR46_04500 [Candidatus Saccharimonadales bacterium]
MKKIYTWLFLALVTLYVLLVFILPTDPQTLSKYNLNLLQFQLLNLSFVIPISLIYLTALYGFVHVDTYANKVLKSKEGRYLKLLAMGLGIQAFSLPLNSLLGTARTYARQFHPDWVPNISILKNYVLLVFTVAALLLVAKGAQGLYSTLKRRKTDVRVVPSFYWIVGPVLLACVYTWLIVAQGYKAPGGEPYYMPIWMIIVTIVAPYVFIWCVGIWAAMYLRVFRNEVKGLIYKRAINQLAVGIGFIILASVFIQGITSLAGVLSRLELTPVLMIVYCLLALYAVGYGLVARGAKKLAQIEEA